jgi:hypothetical protein
MWIKPHFSGEVTIKGIFRIFLPFVHVLSNIDYSFLVIPSGVVARQGPFPSLKETRRRWKKRSIWIDEKERK